MSDDKAHFGVGLDAKLVPDLDGNGDLALAGYSHITVQFLLKKVIPYLQADCPASGGRDGNVEKQVTH
jgi:hypothetical protein